MDRRACVAGVVLIATMSLTACGSGAQERIVAQAGNIPITAATLAHWIGDEEGDSRGESPREQTLSFLIASDWLIEEAAEEHAAVSGQEIEQRLKARIASYANGEKEFHEALKVKGQTVADVILDIKWELASAKIHQMLMRREHEITEAQAAAYYSENKPSFVAAEERQVVITSTESEVATERIRREVELGRNLVTIPLRKKLIYTRHPPRNALERAIYSAAREVLTGPVRVGPNYFVFEVRHIVPARQRSFAQVRTSIEAKLTAEQRQRNLIEFVKSWEKRWVPRTSCSPAFIVRQCKQYPSGPALPEIPASLE